MAKKVIRAGNEAGDGAALGQRSEIFTMQVIQVIERGRAEFKEGLKFRWAELAHVRANSEAMQLGCREDLRRLRRSEGSVIAKDVDEVRQLPLGGLRNHLVADFAKVAFRILAKFLGDHVCSEERGDHGSGPLPGGEANCFERLNFRLHAEAVA